MLAISIIIDNPAVLTGLDANLPGATWLGVQDYSRTFFSQLKGATPIGWKYKKQGKTKKGKVKTGTGKWVRSGALRKSWEQDTDAAARGITFSTDLPYIHVLEQGLYPNPPKGPARTNVPWTPWRVEGGFSKQAPKGIAGPLLTDEKLERAIDLVVVQIRKMLERVASA